MASFGNLRKVMSVPSVEREALAVRGDANNWLRAGVSDLFSLGATSASQLPSKGQI